jgi:hypothetical protein
MPAKAKINRKKELLPDLDVARALKRMDAVAGSIRILPAGAVAHLFPDLDGLAPPTPPTPPMGRWRSLLARIWRKCRRR